jgi:hypothetical protein
LLSLSQSSFAEVCKGKAIFKYSDNVNSTEITVNLDWTDSNNGGQLKLEIPEVLKEITVDSYFTKIPNSKSTYEFHKYVGDGLTILGTITGKGNRRYMEGTFDKQNAGKVTFITPELKCE